MHFKQHDMKVNEGVEAQLHAFLITALNTAIRPLHASTKQDVGLAPKSDSSLRKIVVLLLLQEIINFPSSFSISCI